MCLNEYRACIASIVREMALNKGWLKPIMLKKLTGTPAQELIESAAKEAERKKKRAAFLQKYRARMAELDERNGVGKGAAGSSPTKAGGQRRRGNATKNVKDGDATSPQKKPKDAAARGKGKKPS